MPLPIKSSGDGLGFRIIGQEEVMKYFDEYKKAISFFRFYPDIFVDFLCKVSGEDCTFKLYPYQRLMLRAMARYTDVNLTFSRGTSKSFIDVLWQMIKCIFYPGTKTAIASSTKDQSSKILNQKVDEILQLIPAFKFEIKSIKKEKSDITVLFKNNSWIMNVAAKGSTRGDRQNSLVTEEIIEVDPNAMESIVRPLLAISRLAANGQRNTKETISRQEIIITTAGVKGSYPHSRLIRNLIRMVTEPGKAIVLGGSYRIPIIAGLQDLGWIRELKMSGQFNPASFPREFLSKWSSGSDQAYFPADTFDKLRSLQDPIFEREENLKDSEEYYFSIDVGRHLDSSEVSIVKRIRQIGQVSTKHLVNLVTFEDMPFTEQAIKIKQLYNRYKPKTVVIDGTGIGTNLVDELVLSQADPETGAFYQPWGVSNDFEGRYKKFQASDTISDLLYIIKANATFNTQMYGNLQTQLLTGKIRFLIPENAARLRIEGSRAKRFKEMTEDDKIEYLKPYYQTSFLKAQMINLESHNDGTNIIMKRANGSIRKDKVSSLGYLLYYIKTELDDKELARQSSTIDSVLGLNSLGGQRQGQRRNILEGLSFNGNRQYVKNKR